MRTGLCFLIASLTLACSASAAAAEDFPVPTVTSSHGSVEPARGSYCMADYVAGRSMCADMLQQDGPDLVVDPNGEVKITLDGDAVEFYAGLRNAPERAGVRATGPREYTLSLPGATTFPVSLVLSIDSRNPNARYSNTWDLRLVAPTEPAVFSPPVQIAAVPAVAVAPEPPATIAADSLKLSGKRLAVGISCPAAATRGCSGTLTLKTPSLRVVRLTFAKVPAGTTRTLNATVRSAALRHLTRHRVRSLRSVLTAASGTPAASQLRLR